MDLRPPPTNHMSIPFLDKKFGCAVHPDIKLRLQIPNPELELRLQILNPELKLRLQFLNPELKLSVF